MIKDESLYDQFDQIFSAHFSGIEKNEDYRFTPEFFEQAKVVSDSLQRAQHA